MNSVWLGYFSPVISTAKSVPVNLNSNPENFRTFFCHYNSIMITLSHKCSTRQRRETPRNAYSIRCKITVSTPFSANSFMIENVHLNTSYMVSLHSKLTYPHNLPPMILNPRDPDVLWRVTLRLLVSSPWVREIGQKERNTKEKWHISDAATDCYSRFQHSFTDPTNHLSPKKQGSLH